MPAPILDEFPQLCGLWLAKTRWLNDHFQAKEILFLLNSFPGVNSAGFHSNLTLFAEFSVPFIHRIK